jgi:hypothetical protein
MSEALTVLNNPTDLAVGGLGLDASLFKLKPATLEIVQRTSRQEGAEPGRFRDTATNVHYDKMEWVLLANPIKQRAAYHKGEFSRDSKFCFSQDNVSPSKFAKEPQAPFCATCPVGSWENYRKSGDAKDIPVCKEFWHLVLADRATQMPYYFNVKGLSLTPFQQGMQNVARLVAAIEANVKAENKAIAARNAVAKAAADTAGEAFTPEAFKPRPNLFDIKFPVSINSQTTANGISYVLVIGKPVYMNAEARAEFGALYLDFANRRAQGAVQTPEESEAAADAAVNASMTEAQAPARSEVAAVVGPIVGTVLPAKSDITI